MKNITQLGYASLFLVQVRLRQEYYAPKLDQTGVRAHDLQIMESTFHVPKTPTLTTEPLGTSPQKPT